jgi:hypothetical protein
MEASRIGRGVNEDCEEDHWREAGPSWSYSRGFEARGSLGGSLDVDQAMRTAVESLESDAGKERSRSRTKNRVESTTLAR